jgi:hypothetical protein
MNPFRWFPEFWQLSRRRLRSQAELLGICLVVGVVAGLGAIVFHTPCQFVSAGTLESLAGYHPDRPGNETELFPSAARPKGSLEEAMAQFVEPDLLALPVVEGTLADKVIDIA